MNMEMLARERVLERERQRGKADAQAVQRNADNMTGTELYAADDRLPKFEKAVAVMNMLDRPIGFVCLSPAGRVVRLLQQYDSTIYTQDPEELPAQWGFKWSTDPAKAQPFIAMATSPFMKNDCCIDNGEVYRSTVDNNVWQPTTYPSGWVKVQ